MGAFFINPKRLLEQSINRAESNDDFFVAGATMTILATLTTYMVTPLI
jgi:hypothetical protein